jgi:glycogen operon protein
MLLAGDEFGRSQMGNNNGYCQDSEISWLHWEELPQTCEDLREFTRRLIALRKEQPLLRRSNWRDGMIIDWYHVEGGHQEAEHWYDGNPLALKLLRPDLESEEGVWQEVLLLFNPVAEDIDFVLPETGGGNWQLELTTFDVERHGDIAEEGKAFRLEARSLALLRRA